MSAQSEQTAREMGERAGRNFIRTGIMPRCPFPKGRPELAAAWINAVSDVIKAARKDDDT